MSAHNIYCFDVPGSVEGPCLNIFKIKSKYTHFVCLIYDAVVVATLICHVCGAGTKLHKRSYYLGSKIRFKINVKWREKNVNLDLFTYTVIKTT